MRRELLRDERVEQFVAKLPDAPTDLISLKVRVDQINEDPSPLTRLVESLDLLIYANNVGLINLNSYDQE